MQFSTQDRFIFGGICLTFAVFIAVLIYLYYAIKSRNRREIKYLEYDETMDDPIKIDLESSKFSEQPQKTIVRAPVEKLSHFQHGKLESRLEVHLKNNPEDHSSPDDNHRYKFSQNGSIITIQPNNEETLPKIVVTPPSRCSTPRRI